MDQTAKEQLYRDDLIRAEMAAQRITVERLAEMAREKGTPVSAETISRARKGANLSIDTLTIIASLLLIPTDQLFKAKTEAA